MPLTGLVGPIFSAGIRRGTRKKEDQKWTEQKTVMER